MNCSKCRHDFEATYLANGKPHKLCPKCRDGARRRMTIKRAADPEAHAAYHRRLRRRYRQEAFDAYGGYCWCCGEEDYEFLTIDHPNGGGRKERKELLNPGGASFARELARR